MNKSRETLKTSFLEVVENQIRDGTPPATRQTFERLQREGHIVAKAKALIASVIAAEMFEIVKHKRTFDEAKFIERLQQLPDMPWHDEPEA